MDDNLIRLSYLCPKCHDYSRIDEWGKVTLEIGPRMGFSIVDAINKNTIFMCPLCRKTSKYKEVMEVQK